MTILSYFSTLNLQKAQQFKYKTKLPSTISIANFLFYKSESIFKIVFFKTEEITKITTSLHLQKHASFYGQNDRYAKWSAQDHLSKTSKVTWFHLTIKPAARFFKHFVLQLGFLDGKVGYQISRIMAWGVKRRYEYLRELLG